ncbi:hypothetical protein AB6A40_010803 [Gnathostoma spinigerum]|uniref:Uncharacterized protein n=1 Tax=Gnathostoma spinigerum TaxID=75299 RepID=A0ABD6F2A4_9BILA
MKSADSEKTEVNSDPSMFVLNTIIEWSFLEELMQASMHVCNQFGPAKRVELIGYAEGFMSVIGLVYPDWTPKNDSLPDTFVVKIPSNSNMQKMSDEAVFEELGHEITIHDEELERIQQNLYKVNNSECAFYEWIEPWQADIEVPRIYVHRKVTDTDRRGLLAMEYVDNASLTEIKSTLRPSEAMAVKN